LDTGFNETLSQIIGVFLLDALLGRFGLLFFEASI
jgi:hypothetical protein